MSGITNARIEKFIEEENDDLLLKKILLLDFRLILSPLSYTSMD